MGWKFKNGIPIYVQIVDEMTTRIANGTYEPGDKLPSVRDLAIEAGVNPNTMQRALSELERHDLVYAERTSGRFVTDNMDILERLRKNLVSNYIEDFVRELQRIGLDRSEIACAVKHWIEEEK